MFWVLLVIWLVQFDWFFGVVFGVEFEVEYFDCEGEGYGEVDVVFWDVLVE